MSSPDPTHQLGRPGGFPLAAAAASPPALHLSPLETSAQETSKCHVSSLPTMSGFQRYVHAGWSGIRSKVHAALIRTAQPEARVKAFENCCRDPITQFIGEDEPSATEWRITAERCHDRLCTPCAAARAQDIRIALHEELNGRACKFVTLTLRTTADEKLADCIDRLYAGFKALRRMPLWEDNVKGGAAFLEITRGASQNMPHRAGSRGTEKSQEQRGLQSGHWHTHLHIIMDANYIKQSELSIAWFSATRDSYIVDIQAAGGGTASSYVTKYVTKALNGPVLSSEELMDEFVTAIKGRRLCVTFGTWYGKQTLERLENEGFDSPLLPQFAWRPATIYTIARILAFVPPTPAGIAVKNLPFIRWLRSKAAAP